MTSSLKRKSDAYENGDGDKRRREDPKGMTDEEREKILEMLDNEPEVKDKFLYSNTFVIIQLIPGN